MMQMQYILEVTVPKAKLDDFYKAVEPFITSHEIVGESTSYYDEGL